MAPRRAAPKPKRAAAPLSQSLTSQPAGSQEGAKSTPRKAPGRRHAKSHYAGPLENAKHHGKFAIAIARIVKDMNKSDKPEVPLKLGRRSMAILNAFAEDMGDRLTSTAIDISNKSGKRTVGSSEANLATRWLLGDVGQGELDKLAVKSGQAAILKFDASRGTAAPKAPGKRGVVQKR